MVDIFYKLITYTYVSENDIIYTRKDTSIDPLFNFWCVSWEIKISILLTYMHTKDMITMGI